MLFKDSVKPTNWQITLWEDLQVPTAATLLVGVANYNNNHSNIMQQHANSIKA